MAESTERLRDFIVSVVWELFGSELDRLRTALAKLQHEVANLQTTVNGAGHFVGVTTTPSPLTVTLAADINIAAGTYRAFYDNAGVATLFDGSELACNNFWGLIGAGNFTAATDHPTLNPIGCEIPQQTTPILGENYAKSDGSLVATESSAVAINQFSLVVAQGADKLRVIKGEVKQRTI